MSLSCMVAQVAKHAESAADNDLRVAVAVALQRQRGGGFDRLTKTKFAAKLLQVHACHVCMHATQTCMGYRHARDIRMHGLLTCMPLLIQQRTRGPIAAKGSLQDR